MFCFHTCNKHFPAWRCASSQTYFPSTPPYNKGYIVDKQTPGWWKSINQMTLYYPPLTPSLHINFVFVGGSSQHLFTERVKCLKVESKKIQVKNRISEIFILFAVYKMNANIFFLPWVYSNPIQNSLLIFSIRNNTIHDYVVQHWWMTLFPSCCLFVYLSFYPGDSFIHYAHKFIIFMMFWCVFYASEENSAVWQSFSFLIFYE